VFEGNFKGTYIRPGNSWDLSKGKQKSGETLREYARRFSKQRPELLHIPDHDIILAFVSGTTSRDLVRELVRNRPQTVDDLMDVVANYAAGEKAVGAFFSYEGGKGKSPTDDDEGPSRGPKKNKKKKKARPFQQEALDDDFVAAVDHKRPRGPPEGAIFDKMLKEPCPYHKGGANQKLEDCRMLKRRSALAEHFSWTLDAKEALDSLKKTLTCAPVLVPPQPAEPLLLYVTSMTQVVSAAVVVERQEEGHALPVQSLVYFVSEVLSETKVRYPQIQKLIYTVILARRKLQHYFLGHPITVVSSFPLGEIIQSREATGRIAKWSIELMSETLTYVPRKAIKSQALVDFVVEWTDSQLPPA